MLTDLPAQPEILDIGCGTGMQTTELARICPECRITAVDVHQPYLDDLARRAAAAGVGERITTVWASMDNLPFRDATFDVLWAEGSIFVMGFWEGLASWRRLLRPGGYLCLTEAVWFTEALKRGGGVLERVLQDNDRPGNCVIAERAGYEVVVTFPCLSPRGEDYYAHQTAGRPAGGSRRRPDAEPLSIFRAEIAVTGSTPASTAMSFSSSGRTAEVPGAHFVAIVWRIHMIPGFAFLRSGEPKSSVSITGDP